MLQLCLAANDRSELRDYIGVTPDQPIVIGGYANSPQQVEVWQFDPLSLAVDNGISVLKPKATLPDNPGRYVRTSQTSGNVSEKTTGVTAPNGTFTCTFGKTYSVSPNVQANIINGSNSQIIKIGTPSITSVTVTVINRVDVIGLLPTFNNVNGAIVDVLVTEK